MKRKHILNRSAIFLPALYVSQQKRKYFYYFLKQGLLNGSLKRIWEIKFKFTI